MDGPEGGRVKGVCGPAEGLGGAAAVGGPDAAQVSLTPPVKRRWGETGFLTIEAPSAIFPSKGTEVGASTAGT